MQDVIHGIPTKGWINIVGYEFHASYLDSPILRERSNTLPVRKKRPVVRKLETPDGRRYKLLTVPQSNQKIRAILATIIPLRNENFIPKLLWSDDSNLLFEYISGDFPDFTSERFAADFAKVLVRLHAYRYRNISRSRYRLEFLHNLRSLRIHNMIDSAELNIAKALYRHTEPRVLRRSLDYFDVNQNNFIYDEEGRLRLIDNGAFRKNRPTGQFLLASQHFGKLNREIFWDTYHCEGGEQFMFEHRQFLLLFHFVMKAGQRARIYSHVRDKASAEAVLKLQRCLQFRDSLIGHLADHS